MLGSLPADPRCLPSAVLGCCQRAQSGLGKAWEALHVWGMGGGRGGGAAWLSVCREELQTRLLHGQGSPAIPISRQFLHYRPEWWNLRPHHPDLAPPPHKSMQE